MHKYSIDFPLCRDKASEEKIRRYITSSCDFIFEHYPENKVKAIILIGSFSKGEGSAFISQDKKLISFSDFEFITVLEEEKDFIPFRKKVLLLNKEISSRLKKDGLDIEIDLGPCVKRLFGTMSSRMFTIDIKTNGKVIWGDREILSNLPSNLDPGQIPQKDAITLLFNRATEQLMAYDILNERDIRDQQKIIYKIGKTYLDIAASLLVFCKQYKPSYTERAQYFELFWNNLNSSWLKNQLQNFAQKVKYWTSFKLFPFSEQFDNDFSFSNIELIKKQTFRAYLELIDAFSAIFIWEMNSYLKCKWVDDKEIIIENFIKKDDVFQRSKGWIKILRHPFFKKDISSIYRLMALIRIGSPKSLIYSDICRLYFSLPAILSEEADKKNIYNAHHQKALPVIFEDYIGDNGDWQRHRKNLIKNWEMFLKSDW